MKLAVVGAICLAAGLLIGAGAPKPALKWKYDTFEVWYKHRDIKAGFDDQYESNAHDLDRLSTSEILFAAPSADGKGWQFLVREPMK